MKKQLRQVGVTGMIVASLAASSGAMASNSAPSSTSRLHPKTVDTGSRRAREAVYQQRLSFLSKVLESDPRELELSLTRLANGQSEQNPGA
jgi:hypothetical protein